MAFLDAFALMIRMIKSITSKEIFQRYPEVKMKLWGGRFWTSGFYANTVGQYSKEEVIRAYVKNQGMEEEYKRVHSDQLTLF
ncbi:MAG: transposase [Bacteroidales bacterium]|nr:transposase [Bacteroidales bacterium]